MAWILRGTFLLLLLLLSSQRAQAQHCASQQFAGNGYLVCTVDPASDDLRLYWRSPDGRPFRHFRELADAVESQGEKLGFAMNAGMYLPDFTPSGLYVEDGKELRPLNTNSVNAEPGRVPNFYKKPNGVFFLSEEGAGVLTTEAFQAGRPPARFATQSGPMLVIEGEIHPLLIPGSSDRTRRSGIGVCEEGEVRLAISDGNVNFHDFAELFRDHLQCPNALFLDGGRGTGIYDPASGRRDYSWHGGFGPMFGLVK
ncbi:MULTISPECIES: phosphodiester glycosidase family protein [unclassified Devosia]|uniref:phosphodiester glycosidase family protein n=1 Tax=unclassified Devosia TaxID=196773 RepID=UPI001556AD32|nr:MULTISPECIES: phosphodiester glycosidase family protein [unclassified Devosia]